MKITRLELHGFKRMALNNVMSFVFTPTQPIQMILGTNGSGKSSLIAELTPLPAEPSAYLPEGSKTIEITHHGSFYVLTSNFALTKVHSFVKDGEELNDGGGVTIQRELVKREFAITPEIHELLIGQEHFHAMSPTKRREWFTRLSDVSYDYALSVFKKLAEKSRDFSGALKLAKKRLVSESAKVISPAEEERLQSDVNATHKELNVLIEQSAPLDRSIEDLRQAHSHGFDELTRMSRRLLNMRFAAPYAAYGLDENKPLERDDWGALLRPHFSSLEEIDKFLDGVRHQITEKETLLNHQVQEHGKVSETVAVLKRTGEAGLQELTEKRADLQRKRDETFETRQLNLEGFEPTGAMQALESLHELLSGIFSSIPQNEDMRFSQTRRTDLEAKLLALKDQRNAQAQRLVVLNAEKTHADTHKANGTEECPKCHHVWIKGYSDEQYQKLLERIGAQEQTVVESDKQIKALEEDVEAIRQYGVFYSDYVRCVRNWPALQPFWNYLTEEKLVTTAPRKALTDLELLKHDLGLELEAKKIGEQIAELEKLIADAAEIGDANLVETQQQLAECTLRIEQLTSEVTRLRAKLADYSTYRRQMAEGMELGERIRQAMAQQEILNNELIEAIRRDTLNHCVRQLQHSLALKQTTLNEAVTQRKIVTEIESYIRELEVKEQAARTLVRELSPTDGLIAEGLFGFIRNFTSQMNNLIRKIWSYPLQVMECGTSSAGSTELDYKFPLMVKSKDNIAPDVSKGSTGMREIVDVAFKVVAMRYLGLAESPLYLDEFGAFFDKEHRHQATIVVKNIMDTQPFTQLFMISHYEANYGAFTNAEICVLDASNITVPANTKYNQHVEIA
jgi:hypothetical protein